MPALLKLALIVAVILLAVGLAVKAVQFLLYAGVLLLLAAAVAYFLRRARTPR